MRETDRGVTQGDMVAVLVLCLLVAVIMFWLDARQDARLNTLEEACGVEQVEVER